MEGLDGQIVDEAIDDAVVCVDGEGAVFRWNRSAERIFGWTAREMQGQSFARMFTPADREAGLPARQLRMAQGAARAAADGWHVRKDGSRFFAMGFVTPLAGGKGFCKVLRDATQQHDTSLALRASQQDARTVADVLPVLIAYVGRDHVYRFANRTYEAWFGVPPERIVGRTLEQYLGARHFARRRTYVDRVLAGEEVRFDDEFQDRHGAHRHIHFHYIPRRSEDGTVSGFYLLGLDISERRQLQERIERDNARLREEASATREELAQRTQELGELARYLQTAQESLRAHLARELHDELGAIFTTAKLDVARLKPVIADTEEARARVQHLVDNLNRGVQLKRRIIEDLKPSALEHFGLAMSLGNLIDDFAAASQLQVDKEIAHAELSAGANLTVYRMVQEGLTNVAKYANASRVRVRSRIDGEWLEVQIADDGVGFDPKQARRSAHGLRGMEFRVQAEGGSFSVHSEPGMGTVLTARLPLARA